MAECTLKRRLELLESSNGEAKLTVVIGSFACADTPPPVVQNGITIVYGSELDARL